MTQDSDEFKGRALRSSELTETHISALMNAEVPAEYCTDRDALQKVREALEYGTEALAANLGIRFTTFGDEGYTNSKKEQFERCEQALALLSQLSGDKGE